MIKAYYFHSGSNTTFAGVDKKINSQLKVLSQWLCIKNVIIEKEGTNIFKSIFWRLPFGSMGRKYNEALKSVEVTTDEKCVFYFRHQAVDLRFLFFIRCLRRRYDNSIIIDEIPTYPYGIELLQDKEMWPFFFKDLLYVRFLHKYVDVIATYTKDDKIFGVPTIKMMNGVDVEAIVPVREKDYDEDVIRIIAVAQFQPSHGYERIIYGVSKYYDSFPKQKVEVHFVGEGKEKDYYMKLVSNLNLEDYFIFHGFKDAENLDELYNCMDIALSCFGLYKRNIFESSALKVREALSKGLPIVSGCHEDISDFGGNAYILEMPNDSSTVNIDEVLMFYKKLLEQHNGKIQLNKKIRSFAEKNIDISKTMIPLIDYLKEVKLLCRD